MILTMPCSSRSRYRHLHSLDQANFNYIIELQSCQVTTHISSNVAFEHGLDSITRLSHSSPNLRIGWQQLAMCGLEDVRSAWSLKADCALTTWRLRGATLL
jgi:hypothetical protein